jgi:hypothetical protein
MAGHAVLARLARPVLALTALAMAIGPGAVRTFEGDAVGRAPAGFSFRVARDSSPAKWLVQREGANSFLAHLGEPPARAGFSLAILDEPPPDGATSFSAKTRLAGTSGSTGILWRVQDPDNYYLARLDLARQDIGLYRVVRGNRVRIEGEDDLELDPNAWHTLKILQEGENIRVYLGGIRVLRARDRTFSRPGSTGLWCTGDAVAQFDDLRFGLPNDKESDDEGTRRGR